MTAVELGIIGGLLAAACGLIDWYTASRDARAKRMGLIHAGINVAVVVLFGLMWGDANVLPLALVAGWLGGEAVDRLGVVPRAH